MYPFPQAVNPAVRTRIDAQTAFLNDMSRSMFRSFQQMCDLNIQLVQTMLEESTLAGQRMLTAERQTEVLTAAAARAQPATDKLRAWQQHVSRLAADAQLELARITEQHAQNTARTARALADEVTRTTAEEAERGLRAQQETVRQFADPFTRPGDGNASPAQSWSGERAGATMQSAAHGSKQQAGGAPQQG